MGEIRELSSKGDTKLMWDPENETETEVAEDHFNSLIEKKFTAYAVKKDGEKGKKITKFDSSLAMIIMVPPMAGG
jgi:hypothetical protein